MSFSLTKWLGRFSFNNLTKKFHRQHQDESLTMLPRRVRGARALTPSVPDFSIEDPEPVDSVLAAPAPASTTLPEIVAPSNHQPPVSLPELELTPVPEILRQFTNRVRADLVLLTDRNGVPMAHSKNDAIETSPPADLEMIAKLAAGQISATQEINRNIGEGDNFIFLFQESGRQNLFIYKINQDFNLIVLIEKTIVMGLVRIHANEVVANLQKALDLN